MTSVVGRNLMAVVKGVRFQRLLKTGAAPHSVRTVTSSPRTRASHYDVLEITPKATQNDIKSAYYKLSKIYHPDKSSDEASARKFRAITEAYEVLGNVNLKKMYDKGLIGGSGRVHKPPVEFHQPEPEPDDPTLRFYKAHANRRVIPTIDGRTPIYDFDTWSKNHYGDLFKKSQYERELLRKKQYKQMDKMKSNQQETLIYLIFALGGLFILLVVQGKEDYDRDILATKEPTKIAEETPVKD
ncbi:dnaJ homolog subfamily C member 30, mitochondrial-like [Pectinophora gossypiella]|uniref:dnaJ homolog subfamily C member 30, mitochondrial-like n=1 Tax=Pectinophora gossypiella TaxID=13191 RepID=UPI00214E548D|nr:dnaJ homolog subfamily C member 30, mitochondrial-like [Pectinophora gossypiella]